MIKNVSILFTSILFEALPFLLLGSIISSIIETFVSDEAMAKMIPKNKILGAIVGVLLGFFIPACDCAVIPVSKRLIKKKVPLHVAISFMLASPIINPVVLLSTYTAFYKTDPFIFLARLALGIIVALIIGIIMAIIFKNEKNLIKDGHDDECDCHIHTGDKKSFKNYLFSIIHHTSEDFFDVVKYLMFGAVLASIFQVALPRDILLAFNTNKVLGIITLMVFAYLISLCSTSDSFVGKSLLSTFGEGSVVAYLLLGPMIDIKNTIVLLGNYKKKFVVTLITLIFIVIFLASILMGVII